MSRATLGPRAASGKRPYAETRRAGETGAGGRASLFAMTRMLLGLLLLLAPLSARAQPVDVALILAVDVSLSMDRDEQRAQRDGYIEAVRHPAVLDAIRRGRRGRIALAYLEWGGPWTQTVIAPWAVIDGPEAAEAFAQRLGEAPISTSRGTSITAALDFALDYFDEAPAAARRVVDVSGDGPNNMGGLVTKARDRALAAGVEINGLPLMIKETDRLFSIPELDIYYQECVVGGPAAFVIPVLDPARFASAIRQKLILEIAGPGPGGLPAMTEPVLRHARAPRMDCTIGEQLYERWRRSMDWN